MSKKSRRATKISPSKTMRRGGGYVTTRKDGTIYSQDRVVVDRGSNHETEVPTFQARKQIGLKGWLDRKFRGTDNVERPVS